MFTIYLKNVYLLTKFPEQRKWKISVSQSIYLFIVILLSVSIWQIFQQRSINLTNVKCDA